MFKLNVCFLAYFRYSWTTAWQNVNDMSRLQITLDDHTINKFHALTRNFGLSNCIASALALRKYG